MTARRMSVRNSALSNTGGGGRCLPPFKFQGTWQGRCRVFRSGKVSSGSVRQVWNVVVRLGSEGYGVVKQGRWG
jgi:hypothetical protein